MKIISETMINSITSFKRDLQLLNLDNIIQKGKDASTATKFEQQ